jgi:hypothetical protein
MDRGDCNARVAFLNGRLPVLVVVRPELEASIEGPPSLVVIDRAPDVFDGWPHATRLVGGSGLRLGSKRPGSGLSVR